MNLKASNLTSKYSSDKKLRHITHSQLIKIKNNALFKIVSTNIYNLQMRQNEFYIMNKSSISALLE